MLYRFFCNSKEKLIFCLNNPMHTQIGKTWNVSLKKSAFSEKHVASYCSQESCIDIEATLDDLIIRHAHGMLISLFRAHRNTIQKSRD